MAAGMSIVGALPFVLRAEVRATLAAALPIMKSRRFILQVTSLELLGARLFTRHQGGQSTSKFSCCDAVARAMRSMIVNRNT